MEIKLAKSAGFCFGVERAVESVYNEIALNSGPIFTYGPIIHNDQVVNDLTSKGVSVIRSKSDLDHITTGTVIIRSHGVSKKIYEEIKRQNVKIVDATCPFVKKIHQIVEEESKNGKIIIIIGNHNHPEVEGIKGWVSGDCFIVNEESQINDLPIKNEQKICIVSQTTFNYNKFKYLVEIMRKKGYDINVVNTICNATHLRQVETREIASSVDAMIVIGGRSSSNTAKLVEICREHCKHTFFIQTANDLRQYDLSAFQSIGITAGASTPKKIIEEVHTECQKKKVLNKC